MTRTPESRARQLRALQSDAVAAVQCLDETRLTQLGSLRGLPAEAVRAELLTFAEREPRRALTALSREVSARAARSHLPKD